MSPCESRAVVTDVKLIPIVTGDVTCRIDFDGLIAPAAAWPEMASMAAAMALVELALLWRERGATALACADDDELYAVGEYLRQLEASGAIELG